MQFLFKKNLKIPKG